MCGEEKGEWEGGVWPERGAKDQGQEGQWENR